MDDSSVPLMHYDPRDLGSLILIQNTSKEPILRFAVNIEVDEINKTTHETDQGLYEFLHNENSVQ